MVNKLSSYKELIVWKKSIDLSVAIYQLTDQFPKSEQYGIISQMRRAVVSISSNIAEGYRRGSKKDYCRFLRIAYGSASELETQIIISMRLGYGDSYIHQKVSNNLEEILKMLNSMIKKLNYT